MLLLFAYVIVPYNYSRPMSVTMSLGDPTTVLHVEEFDRVYGVSLWFHNFQLLSASFTIFQENLFIHSLFWWIQLILNLVNDN